jgi:DnaJ-class molecular chaperone
MMDLYQRLGVKRGATEAEIKKAYRSLAKQLHPDRNTDNPKAAERFSAITSAYDLLSDKDKRARYDRGEIDEDGNPKSVFGGGGFGGGGNAGGGSYRTNHGGAQGFPGGHESVDPADLSDLFEGLFGGGGARRAAGGAGFGRNRAPQKGGDIAYRLKVPFTEAATLTPQRVTLSGGKTVDLKLPKGVEDGTRIRLAGQGQEGLVVRQIAAPQGPRLYRQGRHSRRPARAAGDRHSRRRPRTRTLRQSVGGQRQPARGAGGLSAAWKTSTSSLQRSGESGSRRRMRAGVTGS